jgi:hypothetical protein
MLIKIISLSSHGSNHINLSSVDKFPKLVYNLFIILKYVALQLSNGEQIIRKWNSSSIFKLENRTFVNCAYHVLFLIDLLVKALTIYFHLWTCHLFLSTLAVFRSLHLTVLIVEANKNKQKWNVNKITFLRNTKII